jgi:hypothetical protein
MTTIAMKKKTIELEGDYIGGEGTLTTEEEKALSAYFQQKKLAKAAAEKITAKNKTAKRITALEVA